MKFFYKLEDALAYKKSHEFILLHRRVSFPIFVDYKASDKWVVFLPGACSRAKPIPMFQRSSYSNQLDANIISFFDPGLLLGKRLANTWFVGTEQKYYGQYLADILKKYFLDSGQDFKKIVVFGTSAGGLPALRIAKTIEDCTVWLGNIQTQAYNHVAFDKMLPILFPKFTRDSCVDFFIDRLDATLMDGRYKLHLFQNASDRFHFRNHYSSYKEWFDSGERQLDAYFYEYDDPETGHGSVGRAKEIALIKDIFSTGAPQPQWAKRV